MFGSSILEVAIGMIFIYLLLSLICTAINEAIASWINKRGQNLFAGIKNLLNDPMFTGLAQQLYTHGLVASISQDAANTAKLNRPPSYMPSHTFALAMLDIRSSRGVGESWQDVINQRHEEVNEAKAKLAAASGDVGLRKAVADAEAALARARAEAETAASAKQAHQAAEEAAQQVTGFSDLPKIQAASVLLEQALARGRALAAQHPDPLGNIQRAVENLPQGHTKESLLTLIDKTKREIATAEHRVEKLRDNIEHWFNDAMDRVRGWYKRWTQKILLGLAAILVILVNADTMMLVQRLISDTALRTSLITAAQEAAKLPPTANGIDLAPVVKKAEGLELPLGWPWHSEDARRVPWAAQGGMAILGHTVLKLVGLLITVFAVSLGAPFWFDTLNRLTNLRGAGPPPGEAHKRHCCHASHADRSPSACTVGPHDRMLTPVDYFRHRPVAPRSPHLPSPRLVSLSH